MADNHVKALRHGSTPAGVKTVLVRFPGLAPRAIHIEALPGLAMRNNESTAEVNDTTVIT